MIKLEITVTEQAKYRGPAHSICNIKVIQQQSSIIPFMLHNFINYDCHMFSRRLVELKNNKVTFKILPKTNEEHISASHGLLDSLTVVDSYQVV